MMVQIRSKSRSSQGRIMGAGLQAWLMSPLRGWDRVDILPPIQSKRSSYRTLRRCANSVSEAEFCAVRPSFALAGQPRRLSLHEHLFGEEVIEGFYGAEFVVFDVEDGVELGDVEDVVNFLGEAEEFEFAAGVADGGVAADQFANAGGVDVVDVSEVEDDFFLAGGDEVKNGVPEKAGCVAEGDASVEVDDGDVANFAGGDGHGDRLPAFLSGNGRGMSGASQ